MKLSEAIKLGSMLTRQFFGALRHIDSTGKVVATCALGAAQLAGYDVHELNDRDARRGVLPSFQYACPRCGYRHAYLTSLIVHLNDEHLLTREQIANWLATTDLDVAQKQCTPVEEKEPVPA